MRIYESKNDNVAETLQSEELHGSYSSPLIVIIIKSRRITWAENTPRRPHKIRNAFKILIGTL
jgi:hypothetical protein